MTWITCPVCKTPWCPAQKGGGYWCPICARGEPSVVTLWFRAHLRRILKDAV